jgi:hypothetical protein
MRLVRLLVARMLPCCLCELLLLQSYRAKIIIFAMRSRRHGDSQSPQQRAVRFLILRSMTDLTLCCCVSQNSPVKIFASFEGGGPETHETQYTPLSHSSSLGCEKYGQLYLLAINNRGPTIQGGMERPRYSLSPISLEAVSSPHNVKQ